MNPIGQRQRGFTFVELIVVLVVLGILAAIAIPRFTGRLDFDQRGYFEELAAALRYAQKFAVASGCPVQFTLDNSTGYQLRQAATAANCATAGFSLPVAHPVNEGGFANAAPSGVTISGNVPLTLVFDTQGEVSTGTDITLFVGTHQLLIHRPSGYVEALP